MSFAKCVGFLLTGAVTSTLAMSAALRTDFTEIVSDLMRDYWKTRNLAIAAAETSPATNPLRLPTEAVPKVGSQVSLYRDLSDLVQVTGVAPDWETQNRIHAICGRLFPGNQVTNQVRVFRGASAPKWLETLEALSADQSLRRVRNLAITMTDESGELSGVVASRELRMQIGQALQNLRAPVASRLEVRAPQAEFELWAGTRQVWLAQGALNSQDKTALEAVLQRYIPAGGKLANSIQADDEIGRPNWFQGALAVLPKLLRGASQPRLKITEGGIEVEGIAQHKLNARSLELAFAKAFPADAFQTKRRFSVQEGKGLAPMNSAPAAELEQLIADSSVEFRSNKSILSKREWAKLRPLATALKKVDGVVISLVGGSDVNTDAELARKRTEQVKAYLVELGVDPDALLIAEESSADDRIVRFTLGERELNGVSVAASANPDEARRVLAGTRVLFDSGKWRIRDSEASKLATIKGALQALSNQRVVIRGSADPSGNAEFNRYLSRQRCEAVRRWLAKRGVKTKGLSVEVAEPSANSPTDQSAFHELRRVEFVLEPASAVSA